MIKLYLFNNVYRKEISELDVQELLPCEDLTESLLQQFQMRGVKVDCEHGKLMIRQGKELLPFNADLVMSGENVTVVYFHIVAPNNAKEFCRKNGIVYFFHTAEKGHLLFPHIHASYAEYEISIYLKDFKIIGKMDKSKREKEAINFVKDHFESICKEWNEIITQQGGPRWEG